MCWFALFAQEIVNFDMVSNILFPPTFARHGIFPPRVLPTQSHVMPRLEIANNLNLNTHKGGFLHRSRCPPSESYPIDCHKYFLYSSRDRDPRPIVAFAVAAAVAVAAPDLGRLWPR